MRLRFRVSCVNSEDKSGFAAFQAILFTSVHFQPAAYTRFNKSDKAVVKHWDKNTSYIFFLLSPLCPFFRDFSDACFIDNLVKLVRCFYLSPNLSINHPQSGAVYDLHLLC